MTGNGSRNFTDLHPADALTRNALRRTLTTIQNDARMSDREVCARLGFTGSWLRDKRTNEHLRASSYQMWARGVGAQLIFAIMVDGQEKFPTPTELGIGDLFGNHEKQDEAARIDLQTLVWNYRVSRGMSRSDVARLAGIWHDTVHDFEISRRTDFHFIGGQRIARAIGTVVVPVLLKDGLRFPMAAGLTRATAAVGGQLKIVEDDLVTQIWNTATPSTVVTVSRRAWREWQRDHTAI